MKVFNLINISLAAADIKYRYLKLLFYILIYNQKVLLIMINAQLHI